MQTNASAPSSLNGRSSSSSPKLLRKTESRAYPQSSFESFKSKVMYYLRHNARALVAVLAFIFVLLIISSDYFHDLGQGSGVSLRGSAVSKEALFTHWGGATRAGSFRPSDAIIEHDLSKSVLRFAAVTDLDQLSLVPEEKKPTWQSLFLPGTLTRTGSTYDISFETPRAIRTQHNEAGRGAEFSELTLYNNRLLTFDDRTGEVMEIINNEAGTESMAVPRFIITEGDGETPKGMKWEWATVKNNELYMGSMGKEYTAPDGAVLNENNMWIGILNARGELRRENWKKMYSFVRHALGATSPGYIIVEAVLWSDHLKSWVFLPRRISTTAQYDENQDEHMGGTKLVLVDEKFTKSTVVDIEMEVDGLRGFSTFAFVPNTKDRHALAIRSVEDKCTGDLTICKQRSYFLVFDVLTGEVLSPEVKYPDNMKFEGLEFANVYTKRDVSVQV